MIVSVFLGFGISGIIGDFWVNEETSFFRYYWLDVLDALPEDLKDCCWVCKLAFKYSAFPFTVLEKKSL